MFERLPLPDGRPLRSAPVQLATFQLDFEEERPLGSRDGIAWQRALEERGYHLPRLASVRQRTVNVQLTGGVGLSAEQNVLSERNGWQVFLDDGLSNMALFSTAINVERANYPGFDQFRQEILDAYAVAEQLVHPNVQQRVLLSYANALSDESATIAAFWRDKVRPHYLGPISDENLGENFSRGLSIYSFQQDDLGADLRIGLQPDQVHKGRVAFVFQIETARKKVSAVDTSVVAETLDSLHTIALKLFQAVLEPSYLTRLRAEDERRHA